MAGSAIRCLNWLSVLQLFGYLWVLEFPTSANTGLLIQGCW